MSYVKKTDVYEGYIYLIVNMINNKKYVGQTTRTVNARVWEHFNKLKKYPISLAIQKYGKENFKVIELTKCVEKTKKDLISTLNKEEIFYIEKFDSLCGHNGYNVDKGGGQATYNMKPVCQYNLDGILIATYDSEVEAERMTGIKSGDISKCCRKKGTSFTVGGFYWSFYGDDYRKSETGIIKNRPVAKYDLNGNLICKYDCVNEITEDKKLRNRIRNCCTGRQYNVDGFVYRYSPEPFNKYEVFKKPIINNSMVHQYTMDGTYIKTYISIKEAGNDNNIARGSISDVCRGKNKSAGGFIWSYATQKV